MKKVILGIGMGILFLSNIVPGISQIVVAEENVENFEVSLKKELSESFESEVLLDQPEVDVNMDGTDVKVDVESEGIKASLELNGDISTINSTDKNIVVSIEDEIEETTNNYSISFGTLEDKEKMDQALENDWKLLEMESKFILEENAPEITVTEEELKNDIVTDGDPSIIEEMPIELETAKVIEEIPVISDEQTLLNSNVVLKNLDTGEIIEYTLDDGVPSVLPLIAGFALTLTGHTAAFLIKTGAAMAVGTAIGFVISHASNRTKTKNYDHYAVKADGNKGLVGYMGLSYKAAVGWVRKGGDVWSKTRNKALIISKAASPIYKSTSSEIHRKKGAWRFHHFHPAIGKVNGKYKYRGTHSFYGIGVYG